ncbi:unnamed protein product [Aspergillus oryzae]|nr:unnamed protein product [Aspergillus oryzae]
MMSNEQEIPGGFEDTDTHDHALLAPGESNAVQKVNNNGKQSDVKWKQASKIVDEQLMPDLSNEDLWLLVRRFNKTYFVAWFLDLLIPVTTGVLVALILFPSTRSLLFPPRITSGDGSDAGSVEQSTRDSITNSPETYKGEAAEQEASNLVNDIANIAMESARGKYGQSVIDGDDAEGSSEPEPVDVGAITADVQAENAPVEDKTKKPMKKKISKATNQTMRVPTNAQLTLALLRLGEINSTPLPPPPTSHNNEPLWPIRKPFGSITSGKNKDEPSSALISQTPSPKLELSKAEARKKKWSKILKFIGRTIATAMKGHIAFDRAMRITESANTKNLIGLLSRRGWITAPPVGPLKFEAKFERKRGTVVIDSSQEQPVLYFTTCQSAKLDDLRLENQKKSAVLFQIPINEIKGLKKTEGLGWKGKLIVELTAGTKDSIDGLVISRMEPQYQSYHVTGMRGRNQLFNRLIAMDAQFWESH